jgi:uncharacterized membrane protein
MTRHLGKALLVIGLVVLGLAAFDLDSPVRPVLTLVFFGAAPGAAIVPRLRVDDPLLAAALVLGVSVAVSMFVAMTMLWTGVSSPVLATAAVLVVTAFALPASKPVAEEASR